MNIKQKSLVTLLGISLVVLLSNSVSAHEQPASKDECAHSWSKEHEHGAHFDKHMQALHAALKLSASQEAAWTEFSTKMKPVEMDRPGHQEWKNLSTPDRLDRMLDNMKSHEKNMTEHAAVVRAFYDTLNQDQKKIFDANFMGHHRRHGKESHDKK